MGALENEVMAVDTHAARAKLDKERLDVSDRTIVHSLPFAHN